jgi:Glycosyltransferase family 87
LLENYLTPPKQLLILQALGLAVLLAWALTLAAGSNLTGAAVSGDFPAFFSAGTIIKEGGGTKLYSPQVQQSVQERLGFRQGSYLAFAYPPWVALLFSFLTPLGFFGAKALWTLLMFGASALAARILAGRWSALAVLSVLLFPPLLHGNIAGQNSAVGLLIVSLISRGLTTRTAREGPLIGVLCGLLAYKPHYGAIVFYLSFLALDVGRPKFVVAFLATLLAQWLLSFSVSGVGWVPEYVSAVREFAELDWATNGRQMVSLISLSPSFREVLSFICVLVSGVLIRKERYLLGTLLVLFSPHTLYYDLALVLPIALLLSERQRVVIWTVSFIATFLFISLKPSCPGQLMAFALGSIALWVTWKRSPDTFKQLEITPRS